MMDVPQPPPDDEIRNIIDRLANFVARNGQDFENMTKQKQRDNPKFQFLFGGEYYGYYTYRVTTEQAILKQQTMRQQMQQQTIAPQQPHIHPNQQQQSLLGSFGNQVVPPHVNPRFAGPPMQFFDQRPHLAQSRFQNHPMNFERPLGPGYIPKFERGHPNFPINPSPPAPVSSQQVFERNQSGNFDRFPLPNPGVHRFDRAPPSDFLVQQPGILPMLSPQIQPGRLQFDGRSIPEFEPQNHPVAVMNFENPVLQQIQPSPQLPPQPPPIQLINIDTLTAQKKAMEEQILQSEKNLNCQQQLLMSQQQAQVEETLRKVQDNEISDLAVELNVDMNEFAKLLQPLMDSCTKESIANGKAWIFTHSSTKKHYDLITAYLLRRVTDPTSVFSQRLHIIYLVNDTLHHCVRKGAEDMQLMLEKIVIPMFCFTKFNEPENFDNLTKLDKLLALWESKPNYISRIAVDKLKNFTQAWAEYKNELVTKHAILVTQIAAGIQKAFEVYQNQHVVFVQHVTQSIKQIDQKIEEGLLQQQQQRLQEEEMRLQQEQLRIQHEQMRQEEIRQQQEQILRSAAGPQSHIQIPHSGYSTGITEGEGRIPDLSRPPPGFNNQQQQQASVPVPEIPRLPYFELPAGLMVPLVKPEDDNYKPIDPSLIRLPPPVPPSERLIQAIEAFYGPPSHDNPRDSEGWERLGLYEYYKMKNLARKQKEDDIREGRRQKSRSPTPIRREQSPSGRSPPRRRYQSKSPSPSMRRRRSRSRSPRRSRRRRSRSRSRSRSPARRSPTPPSFGTIGLGMERALDSSNKGHQLLKKMGWSGSGLGANEQGIDTPIKGGEIRDRTDQYKGVGVNLQDPFESYRKSKGQAFVERMRARADERP